MFGVCSVTFCRVSSGVLHLLQLPRPRSRAERPRVSRGGRRPPNVAERTDLALGLGLHLARLHGPCAVHGCGRCAGLQRGVHVPVRPLTW